MFPYTQDDMDGMSPSRSHPGKGNFLKKFIALMNSVGGQAVILAGQTHVTVQLDPAYFGSAATATLNFIDATASSIKAATIDDTGLLTITANAAAAANTAVSYYVDASSGISLP
jgi:hypothetical protein